MTVYIEYTLQMTPTKDAVWVHAADGGTVGRFGKMGIDIHTSIAEQLETGKTCLLCTHEPVTPADWALFRAKAVELWNIVIPEDAFEFKD